MSYDSPGRFIRAPRREQYDLIILGSGPAGQRAAVQACKLGKSVMIIEKSRVGGSCLHLGTIPSKALREAALAATADGGSLLRSVFVRTHRVIEDECQIIEEALVRNKVDILSGTGSFVDAHHVQVENKLGKFTVRGEVIIVAVGTRPRRPSELHFDGETLFDSDTILGLQAQPRSLLVLGGGVIGCEYASIFARMGVRVTLVESRPRLLASMDPELVSALVKEFERAGIDVRLATKFSGIKRSAGADGRPVAVVTLEDAAGGGERDEKFDTVLYCLGRSGNCEELNLAAVGLKVNDRGTFEVNDNYQTAVPNIYAVGDVIGAPALAASSAEQGRLAALHAFSGQEAQFPETFPTGIYTIPEISTVGLQESDLGERKSEYVVAKAHYAKLARGKIMSDETGFLKLIVHAQTHRLVGVAVIGASATELIHIGQVAMSFGAKVEFFVENVFNYPTLAEAYKVAAHKALNVLSRRSGC